MSKILKSEYDFEIKLPSEKSFPEYILSQAEKFSRNGRKEMLTDARSSEIVTYNFSDMEPISRKVANYFHKRGLALNDIVINISHDVGLLYFIYLGIWRANGVIRSIYSEETNDVLIDKIRESKAKWVLADKERGISLLEATKKEEIGWKVEILAFGGEFSGLTPISEIFSDKDEQECPRTRVGLKDIALMMPTSGTTGLSKGAVHSHESLLYNIRTIQSYPTSFDLRKPMYQFGKSTHVSSVVNFFAYMAQGQWVIRNEYSVEALFGALEKFKVESLFAVTPLLTPLVDSALSDGKDLSSLKVINCCGAIITPALYKALFERLPNLECISNLYGMTECVLFTSSSIASKDGMGNLQIRKDTPIATVGKLCPGTQLKVRDIDSGQILGPNQVGELCFKTRASFISYLNNIEDTKKTLEDGFLNTGDCGYYDEDGFIYVTDRCKDMFHSRINGNHVSPSEIEQILLKHYSILEACVVPSGGFAERGSLPRAFVVIKGGCIQNEDLAEEIRNFANDQLADFKHLEKVTFIASLPKGKTGKILRRKLIEFTH